MPTLTIDGQEVTVEDGATVLQACEEAGVEVPRFCYHDRLSVAGNCRMCLVEMEKAPKPIASCAMPAGEGMVIHTNTPSVEKARNGVMEFLLINHPLDCPICDQGGECDLQDQAVAYGKGDSRYDENKRAVKDKYIGPTIKTIMTRCIHCTRCIRFSTEIAGVEELGAVFRGEETEITTYISKAVSSELSGNLADVCPVGALTHRAYAFAARPWELRKTESIDVHDAVGSNIRVDARGRDVMRVLPRLHEDVNEEWISDRTRYAVDGLKRQRLDRPYVRIDGKLLPVSWNEAFDAIKEKVTDLPPEKLAVIAGDQCDAESMYAMKCLADSLEIANIDCRQDGMKVGGEFRGGYLFNTTIAGIEDADALVIVGADPCWEASLVNARIRKRWLTGHLKVAVIGETNDLTYRYNHLGTGTQALKELAAKQGEFAEILNDAENPMIIVGSDAISGADGAAVLHTCGKIAEDFGMIKKDWNGFNILHRAASRVAGMDLNILPGENGLDRDGILTAVDRSEVQFVWLMAADELPMDGLRNAFVVYQGHHGDAGAAVADVILPGAAYTEKDGTYVNLEGRAQAGRRAVFPPGEAKEDWAIIRAFSDVIGKTLPFNNLGQLRLQMIEAVPTLGAIDEVSAGDWGAVGVEGAIADRDFTNPVEDFYLDNAICRASAMMAECSRSLLHGGDADTGATGTDG